MDTQRLYLKVCEQCECQFESHFAVTRYCSPRCANLSKKHKLRDERLQNLGDDVRERERLALLDKNFLTIADAARLLQMSRNTLSLVPSVVFSQTTVLVTEMVVATLTTSSPAPMKENIQPSSLHSSISFLMARPLFRRILVAVSNDCHEDGDIFYVFDVSLEFLNGLADGVKERSAAAGLILLLSEFVGVLDGRLVIDHIDSTVTECSQGDEVT